jgi:hypothetical protein
MFISLTLNTVIETFVAVSGVRSAAPQLLRVRNLQMS